MKILFLLFLPLSVLGMDDPRAWMISSKFDRFQDLPTHLRAKIIFHSCDDIGKQAWFHGHKQRCRRVLPFLQTCKNYYCTNDVFSGELLKLIGAKYSKDILCLGLLYLNIPASRLFMKQFINTRDEHKKLFENGDRLYVSPDDGRFCYIMAEIYRTGSHPLLLTSNNSTPRSPTQGYTFKGQVLPPAKESVAK